MTAPGIIGLGYRCEVAHQIRTQFGDQRAMPFDWLVTPLASIPLMVEESFRHMIDARWLEPIEIVRRGRPVMSVINRRYHVLVPHEFPQDAKLSLAEDWQDHLEAVAAKWAFLAERWRSVTAGGEPILFIRRGGNVSLPDKALTPTSAQDYLAVFEALRSVAKDCRLLVVDPECDLGGTGILTDSLGEPDLAEPDERDDTWTGPTRAWGPLLERISS